MELRHLRHFVALAETLSFTDAAGLIGISQPALSSSIRALEDDLGTVLIDRGGRRISLTDAGQRLRHEGGRLLDDAAALPGVIRRPDDAVTGTVTIGVVQAMSSFELADVLARIRTAQPGVAFRIVQDTTTAMRRQLHEGVLDLAFVYRTGEAAERGLRHTRLYDERLVLIVCDDDPLAGRRRVHLEELRRRRWIDFAPGTDLAATMASLDRRHQLAREVVAQVGQLALMADLVRTGLGIAVVPSDARHVSGVTALDLDPGPLKRTLTVAHRIQPLSAAARLTLRQVVASRSVARTR